MSIISVRIYSVMSIISVRINSVMSIPYTFNRHYTYNRHYTQVQTNSQEAIKEEN
jgi:hypothetical protein